MKFKSIFLFLLVFVFGGLAGYFIRESKGEILYRDMTRSATNQEIGFYKVFDYWTENINNRTEDSYGGWGVKGLAYCNFVVENQMQLPQKLFGSYVKVGDKVLYEGNTITTCSNCKQNENVPYLLFDGKKTYYQGIMLSGFDYGKLKVLDSSLKIFTDTSFTYYQNILLTGFDYSTFSMINSAIPKFRDKNYIYTKAEQTSNTPFHFVISTGTVM